MYLPVQAKHVWYRLARHASKIYNYDNTMNNPEDRIKHCPSLIYDWC